MSTTIPELPGDVEVEAGTTSRRPHTVRTTHIQRLIRNGLDLAERCNGTPSAGLGASVVVPCLPWARSHMAGMEPNTR